MSDDPVAAALVAVGIGRAESVHRRVVVGDLAGELAPIQALVSEDDAHGIYDSFVFGISLERVIHSVDGDENFNVLPGGTESPATEEILGSKRWQRIASEFAGADALLLLVAANNTAGLEKLAVQLDGVMVVGDPSLGKLSDAVVLARVPHPAPAAAPAERKRPTSADSQALWRTHRPLIVAGGVVLLLALAAIFRSERNPVARAPDTAMIPATAARDSTSPLRRAALLPANPADSSAAAAFAVEILAANTAEGANFELQRHGQIMPAATISMVPVGNTEVIWYKVFAGAFVDSSRAAQLLSSLRRRHVIPDSAGEVVRAPYALRVDSVLPEAAVMSRSREKIQAYTTRGLAVYALMQRDGGARLYAGAFETPEESSLAATALRVAGATPVLEYRIGRAR